MVGMSLQIGKNVLKLIAQFGLDAKLSIDAKSMLLMLLMLMGQAFHWVLLLLLLRRVARPTHGPGEDL
jgi:hypothetical protein